MPYVAAIHDISNPAEFWSTAGSTEIPAGITLHSTYPSGDGSRATCLWDADSVETVRNFVDSTLGQHSQNQFFEVDANHAGALGLP